MTVSDQDTLDVLTEGKRLIVTEEDNGFTLAFRFLWGGFLLAIGGLVLAAFFLPSGPSFNPDSTYDERLVGGALVTVLLVALGVIPCCLGLSALFLRDRFVFDTERGYLETHKTVFGWTVYQRASPLDDFNSVVVAQRKLGGALTAQSAIFVECRAHNRSVNIGRCATWKQATDLASRIAAHTHWEQVSIAN